MATDKEYPMTSYCPSCGAYLFTFCVPGPFDCPECGVSFDVEPLPPPDRAPYEVPEGMPF